MTWTSMIRFAPLTTLDRINDERWAKPRTLYDSGGLTLFPKTTVRLTVDHHDDQVIGTVREIFRHEDTDGPWLACIATITDRPNWLKPNNPVSFSFISASINRDAFGCEILRRGLISEVSVLHEEHAGRAVGEAVDAPRDQAAPAADNCLDVDPQLRRAHEDARRRGVLSGPTSARSQGCADAGQRCRCIPGNTTPTPTTTKHADMQAFSKKRKTI